MGPQNNHYVRCLEALKGSRFFKDTPHTALRELLDEMSRDNWSKGTGWEQCEMGERLHFIVNGKLKVYQYNPETYREHTIFILFAGDVFDLMSLLDSQPHEVFWETLETLELLSLPMVTMRAWMDRNPLMHKAVIREMGQRVRQLEQMHTDISLYNTLVRLANLILRNINTESRELEHIDNLPNHEIASLLGTTRAVVNRHIQELKNRGAISVQRGQMTIKNIDQLLDVALEKTRHTK